MMGTIDINVDMPDMAELLKRLGPELLTEPMLGFWFDTCTAIENAAKDRAPSDMGRLKSSITHTWDKLATPPLEAFVGTNVEYAPYMEYGTGRMGDPAAPYQHKSGHWPPGAALEVWAHSHGFQSGYQVAAIIGKRGGLKPRRFLRDGFDAAKANIVKYVSDLAAAIGRKWEYKG